MSYLYWSIRILFGKLLIQNVILSFISDVLFSWFFQIFVLMLWQRRVQMLNLVTVVGVDPAVHREHEETLGGLVLYNYSLHVPIAAGTVVVPPELDSLNATLFLQASSVGLGDLKNILGPPLKVVGHDLIQSYRRAGLSFVIVEYNRNVGVRSSADGVASFHFDYVVRLHKSKE